MWRFCRKWANETGQPFGQAIPAVAFQHHLETLSDEAWEQLNKPVIVLDPDNPVGTEDEWLAARERKLHDQLRRNQENKGSPDVNR